MVQDEPLTRHSTPLHLAAMGALRSEPPLEYLDIIDVLLTHGADPYACHTNEVRMTLTACTVHQMQGAAS